MLLTLSTGSLICTGDLSAHVCVALSLWVSCDPEDMSKSWVKVNMETPSDNQKQLFLKAAGPAGQVQETFLVESTVELRS